MTPVGSLFTWLSIHSRAVTSIFTNDLLHWKTEVILHLRFQDKWLGIHLVDQRHSQHVKQGMKRIIDFAWTNTVKKKKRKKFTRMLITCSPNMHTTHFVMSFYFFIYSNLSSFCHHYRQIIANEKWWLREEGDIVCESEREICLTQGDCHSSAHLM